MPYTNKEDLYASQERHRNRNKQLLYDFLLEHPCVHCGESDPIVLEFDHIDSSLKLMTVSRMVSGSTYSWSKIQEEIDKCQVLCANCHRRKTYTQLGHGSWLNQL